MHVHRGFWTVSTSFLLIAIALTAGTLAQSEDPNGICHEIDPNQALANGFSVPLRVKLLTQTLEPVRTGSGTVGPGMQSDADNLLTLDAPEGGNIAKLRVVNAHSESVVEDNLFAQQTSVAEVANVTLLNGDIKATVLKARANTRTTTSMADVTGNGTASMHVEVLGRVYDQVAPNTKIPLPADKFGEGSWVKLYERIDVGLFPHGEKPWYVANQTIRMIHVRVTDGLGLTGVVDIVVGEVFAYSQTPTPFCGGIQGINASAYGVRLKNLTGFWMAPSIYAGKVQVAHTGGWNEQTYTDVTVRNNDHIVSVDTLTSRATGVVDLGVVSKSTAVSKLANVCLMAEDHQRDTDCLIRASAIRAESHSRAWHDEANSTDGPDYDTLSWGSSYILDLWVAGVDVCHELGLNNVSHQGQNVGCKPQKNTELVIQNEAADLVVHLNERQRDLDPEGHTEYTVRAIRIEGTIGGEPIHLTLGRAYTEADYGARDDS